MLEISIGMLGQSGERLFVSNGAWVPPLPHTGEDSEGLLLLMDPLPALPRCAGEGVGAISAFGRVQPIALMGTLHR
jgi:hypothetical protein